MKVLICTAMLVMVGCGVVPQAQLEPVGGTRDLVSKEQRLYAQEVAYEQYCVFMESKTGKSTQLLTQRGALGIKQLEKLIGNQTYWEYLTSIWFWLSYGVWADEIRVREDRFAAMQVRDVDLAVLTKRFDKITARIRNAKPKTAASGDAKCASVPN